MSKTQTYVQMLTYIIGHIVSHALAKHGCDQLAVHFSCIEVLVFGVKEQGGAVGANQVSECLSHHCKAEHIAVLCVCE